MLRRSAVVGLLVALMAANAGAEEDEAARTRAREHYLAGTKLFDLAKYDEAIREYELAYQAKDDPALLYNIAQAHRLGGHPAEAIHFYKVFLQKSPKMRNREEVQLKIHELEKLLEQQQRSRNIPPDQPIPPPPRTPSSSGEHVAPTPESRPPPAASSSTGASTPAADAPPPPAEGAAASPGEPAPTASRPTSPGRSKKIVGISLGAVGVGLLAGGAACSGLAVAAGNTVTREAHSSAPFDPSQESNGRTLQVVGPVLLAAGALAVAAGITLYYLGHREGKRAVDVATVRF